MLRYAALALPLLLAACGSDGTTNLSVHDDDGDVNISTGADGHASIKLPGIDASIKVPGFNVNPADVDMAGLKLYPGSKIINLDVAAHDGAGNRDGQATVTFEAPASLDKVKAWFGDAMAKHHFKVSPQGNGFAGTTDDGQPITLELQGDGADKAKGKMTVGA